MSDYITDPELLAQLNGASQEKKKEDYVEDEATLAELNKGDGYIDDPELLKQLNASTKGPVKPEQDGINPLGAVSPAVTAYGYGSPTGMKELGQAVKAGATPYMNVAKEGLSKTADIYKARPIMAPLIDAAGVATMGFPPIAGGQQVMGAYDKLKAGKEGVKGVSQELSKGEQTKDAYNAMKRALYKNDPGGLGKTLTAEYGAFAGGEKGPGAGNNAVRNMLSSAEGKAAMAANPEFASAAQAYLKTVPTYGQQAMKVVSPLLKGAARIASPVGNAMLGYDMVNQFAENKQQIEANPNAAGLESNPYAMQLRGQAPSVAAAGAMNQRAVLNRPTPAPLTPQEASNLLQSDDARTINIYGGRASLEALVKSGVRQKAASRVLGPVAPGQ